jgi:hypothetical protein
VPWGCRAGFAATRRRLKGHKPYPSGLARSQEGKPGVKELQVEIAKADPSGMSGSVVGKWPGNGKCQAVMAEPERFLCPRQADADVIDLVRERRSIRVHNGHQTPS